MTLHCILSDARRVTNVYRVDTRTAPCTRTRIYTCTSARTVTQYFNIAGLHLNSVFRTVDPLIYHVSNMQRNVQTITWKCGREISKYYTTLFEGAILEYSYI